MQGGQIQMGVDGSVLAMTSASQQAGNSGWVSRLVLKRNFVFVLKAFN